MEQSGAITVWRLDRERDKVLIKMHYSSFISKGFFAAAFVILISSSQASASDKGPNAKDMKTAEETAARINALPGAKIKAEDLMHPPIQGFHPVKKLLKPLTNLESTTDKLDAKAKGLQKPINDLNKPMVGLQQKMVSVDQGVTQMEKRMKGVSQRVAGARDDMATIRHEIGNLKKPIVALQQPVEAVAKPLESVEKQLNLIFCALLIGTLIVAFGTPLTGLLIFKYRQKLFRGFYDNSKATSKPAARV